MTIASGIAYLRWAFQVPRSATYDLSQSGMPDAVDAVASVREVLADFDPARGLDRRLAPRILEAFREAAARSYGLPHTYFVPTLGTGGAVTQALLGLARPGDHVVVERPAYEPLWKIPAALGLEVARVDRRFEDGWKITSDALARVVGPRTKVVVISNPHNPTGAWMGREEIGELAEIAARVGATLLVDEVYLPFVGAGAGRGDETPGAAAAGAVSASALGVADNVVIASSMTKALGLASLRAGWLATRDEARRSALAEAAFFLHVQVPLTAFDLAARLFALEGELLARARAASLRGRRILARFLAEARHGIRALVPPCGLCTAIRLPPAVTADALAEHLRDRYDTLVVPGRFFDAPDLVRVGLAPPADTLERGLANLEAAVEDLLHSAAP